MNMQFYLLPTPLLPIYDTEISNIMLMLSKYHTNKLIIGQKVSKDRGLKEKQLSQNWLTTKKTKGHFFSLK